MAIEQFVKHVEGLEQHHNRAKALGRTKHSNIAHLSADLVKLKDMLKQAMDHQGNRSN